MRKVSLTGPNIIFPFILLFCYANLISVNSNAPEVIKKHDNALMKKYLMEEILRTVQTLSLDPFSNKSSIEKSLLLMNVEAKLNKSSQASGQHGMPNIFDKHQNELAVNKVMRRSAENLNGQDIKIIKNKLVHKILKKTKTLAKTLLKNANTKYERKIILDNLKKMLIESANRQPGKLGEIKTYIDLITKGIDVMKRSERFNRRRTMEFVLNDNIDVNKDSSRRNQENVEPLKVESNDIGIYNFTKKPASVTFITNEKNHTHCLMECEDTLSDACLRTHTINKFECQTGDGEINILKVCDGVNDCSDFSDEQKCIRTATESVENAIDHVGRLGICISQNCYLDKVNGSLIAKQIEHYNNALLEQLGFLQEHSLEDSTSDSQSTRTVVNKAVTVVESLYSTIRESLCSLVHNIEKYTIYPAFPRSFDVQNRDSAQEVMQTTTFSPETCKCNNEKCISKCSSDCEQICWEKYGLTRYNCPAVTGERTIPIDMICDGKLDCYDESDESSCSRDSSIARFEASAMYKYILEEIKRKAASASFESVRNRLLTLHVLVAKLQKLTMLRHPDVLEVKRVREAAFAELMAIYENSLGYVLSNIETLDTFVFLNSINERLVSALKRSHTGNDKVISRDECICRGTRCAVPRCSKPCSRACEVTPLLTKYFCGSNTSTINNAVPIDFICNGKINCPDGDDEKHCIKDVCRMHHLAVLRRNLRNVGQVHQGTAMGEALMSWRSKVTAALLVAEKQERPTPQSLRDIVHHILHDLVMSYSTVEDSRRANTSTIFREYLTWAHVVIDTLRSCGK